MTPAGASEESVTFASARCSQFVTNLQVDAARVRPYVPDRYHFSREPLGKAAVGYRIHACARMTVDGEARSDVVWSELGVRIVAPETRVPDHVDTHVVDGHDYYMIFFHTNDAALAAGMQSLGAPALRLDEISFAPDLTDLGGALAAGETVPDEGSCVVAMQLLTPESPRGTPDFHLYGWYEGPLGLVRYEDFRSATTGRFGRIDVHADATTSLAKVLGQTDVSTYDAFVSFATSSHVELV